MISPLHIVLLDYRDIHHPQAGGAEIFLNEIFQRIAAHGHKVTLLCGTYPGAASEERLGNFRILRAGNMATANFFGAYSALRLARRERVDLFVENLCKLPFLLPAFTRTPVLPIVHHLFGHTIFRETNPLFGSYVWLYEKLIPLVYRRLRFVTVSKSTAQDLVRRGIEAERMEIVHNGLDLKRYHPCPDVPKEKNALILYLGRLKRYKGIDTVIRAFARVRKQIPEARLALVGRGDDEGRLRTLARNLGLTEAVLFVGFVEEEEKIDWLRRAHALVYPSPREGWGISTIEAASCGTPVLASNSEGLREAVRHEETGLLIPHEDVEAWAHRMVDILTDVPLRERLGATGVEWAKRFDWDAEARTMRILVEELASSSRQKRATR